MTARQGQGITCNYCAKDTLTKVVKLCLSCSRYLCEKHLHDHILEPQTSAGHHLVKPEEAGFWYDLFTPLNCELESTGKCRHQTEKGGYKECPQRSYKATPDPASCNLPEDDSSRPCKKRAKVKRSAHETDDDDAGLAITPDPCLLNQDSHEWSCSSRRGNGNKKVTFLIVEGGSSPPEKENEGYILSVESHPFKKSVIKTITKP